MAYRVGLERGAQGGPLAWVLDYPGCFAFGHTEREVLARIPQAVREYFAWLGAHGIPAARSARRCGGRPGTNGITWPISGCCAAPWGADASGCGRTDGAQRA